jgi:hypothetical protein
MVAGALTSCSLLEDPQAPSTPKVENVLIDILETEKKYKEAEKILKEKLDFERKKYGEKSLKISEDYGKLGTLAALDARVKEANEYYEKSIA